jgi:hypothetical protein
MHHTGAKSTREQFPEMQCLQSRLTQGHRVPHNSKTSVEGPDENVHHILLNSLQRHFYVTPPSLALPEKLIVLQLLQKFS